MLLFLADHPVAVRSCVVGFSGSRLHTVRITASFAFVHPPQFKGFLQCCIENKEYYEPFLQMLSGLDEDDDAEDAAEAEAASQAAPKPANSKNDG